MLSETREFTARWLWHFSELGEEKQQFKKHLCGLHNDLFYKEIVQRGLCMPRMIQGGFCSSLWDLSDFPCFVPTEK